MANQDLISQFSPHLFWDVDTSTRVDLEQYDVWFFARVVEYGLYSDWLLLKQLYTRDRMRELAKKCRNLDVVSQSFVCTYLNLSKTELRSYTEKLSAGSFLDS